MVILVNSVPGNGGLFYGSAASFPAKRLFFRATILVEPENRFTPFPANFHDGEEKFLQPLYSVPSAGAVYYAVPSNFLLTSLQNLCYNATQHDKCDDRENVAASISESRREL